MQIKSRKFIRLTLNMRGRAAFDLQRMSFLPTSHFEGTFFIMKYKYLIPLYSSDCVLIKTVELVSDIELKGLTEVINSIQIIDNDLCLHVRSIYKI
ncbi:hypothetical protein BGP75_22095 [Motiliproteus sp. MSK22-1]|nr:hypothetical protein BGP75_22095 [Motiliproteus sp. MSK22-1]